MRDRIVQLYTDKLGDTYALTEEGDIYHMAFLAGGPHNVRVTPCFYSINLPEPSDEPAG
jgi:hypothetical protein